MNGNEQIELRAILNDISDEVFEKVIDFVDKRIHDAYGRGSDALYHQAIEVRGR